MKTKLSILACLVLIQFAAKAQMKIGNNPTSINSASLLELETTNKGFVLPRVALTDVSSSLPLPSGLLTGTVVYDTISTTTGGSGAGIYYWDGSKWLFLSSGSSVSGSAWLLTGNIGLSSSTNFIGTTDAADFVARTANTERMRILGANSGSSKAGWIGMGVTVPRSSLDVQGHFSNKNVLTIENSSTSGFSSVDMMDSAGNLKGTFGYANTGTGGIFAGKNYFNTYATDFLFTDNIGNYDFYMKGSNGYVGINTNTPSERLHVVGNLYLTGAFMPGGSAGTSGYVLTSAGVNTAPTWNNLNGLSWGLTGNSGTSYATNFLGTTDNVSMRFRTNNVLRMIIDSTGNTGIGLSNPSYKLSVLSSSNPLYLSGVQATSTFTADSLLLINGGVVKKSPVTASGAFWRLEGNAGTNYATSFIGTTDNVSLRFRTNVIQRMIIDSVGNIGIGLNNPSYRLSILSASNPLYLSGVQATSTFTADSILTINSGVVKKTPYSSLTGNFWSLTGNSGTSYATNFLGTTDNVSQRFRTNNIERVIIDSVGSVGIGLSNPSYRLSVLSSSNPLYLSGVQATSTFTADSILTINSGVVKKTPYSSLTGNFWSLTGNSGTSYATNFLGTADNASLRFRTNNTEQMIIDSTGKVSIGATPYSFDPANPPKFSADYGTTTSNTMAYFRGSINDYYQINLQNKNSGTNASTDYIATADDGTDSTYYVDMGINSSTYAPGVENWGSQHDAYLYASSRNLLIGCQSSGSDVIFMVGGGKIKINTALRIKGENGNIIVGTGEASTAPIGNTLRAPNAQTSAVNTAGGALLVAGGSSTGTAAGGALNLSGGATSGSGNGGSVNISGGGTSTGSYGAININAGINSATNINTGTSTGTVTLGNSLNNINLPKLSATSVVITDASKNLASTTPSNNTYLYFNGTNFTWAAAATLGSFSVTSPLTYNNTTGAFGINQANTTTDGYLSSTDWNTFNNKVGSITLNTPSSVFSNPINFSVSSGAATGALSLNTQTANTVFAGPVSGAAAAPTFRALVAADIPSLSGSYIQNQTTLQASSNFNISGNGTIGTNFTVAGKTTLAGVTNTGTLTTSAGDVSINLNSNNTTNINSGTSTANVTIGNNNNNILFPKFSTAGSIIYTAAASGQIAGTGSNMIWDAANNRLGIGILTPAYKLSVLSSADPLYLSGVQATSSFTTDSILTILNGVVKKAPYSSLSIGSDWSITGNSGTSYATNFLGTTDNVSLRFRTNNVQRVIIDSVGKVGIGTSIPSSDLTLYQSSGSGSSKGFTFTGNSIGNTNTGTGFLMSLGYNTTGNKQLWLGDADYAGNVSGSFARFVTTGTVFPVIDAVSGDNSLRRYLAFGVTGDANSGVIFGSDNTNVNPGSQVWDNGNMTIGAGFKSYAAPSNGLLVQGSVGIGTASPSNALSVSSTNPLYLAGVQATATFSSDSVLTINAGVVKKTPYNSLPVPASAWVLTGNSGTTAGTNFLGTTDAQPLVIKSLSRQLAYFDGNLYSIALGFGASNTSSDNNIAIGSSARTSNQYCLALGYNASASGVRSIAIGNGGSATTASGAEAVAIGYNAISSAVQTVSLGYQATASGSYGVAIGFGAQATASQSTAIGYSSLASAQYTNAIGYQAQATGLQSTAIGYRAQTSQSNTILLGDVSTTNLYVGIGTATPTAKLHIVGGTTANYPLQMTGLPTGVSGTDNILTINSSGVVGYVTPANFNSTYWSLSGNAAAAGSFLGTTNTTALQFKFNSTGAGYLDANNTSFGTSSASTSGTSNTAIGYSATASNSATAVGANAIASFANTTAIGNGALANVTQQATAIGASSQSLYQYNVAVGYNAQATSSSQETVIGSSAQAQGQNNIAVGYSARANGSDKITVIGSSAQGSFQNNTAIGYSATAIINNQATAVGALSNAGAQNATAVGYNAQSITNTFGTAVGTNSQTTGQYSSAIGAESDATAQYATALGYNAQATTSIQTTAIGANTSATGSNSTAMGYGATTSQNNAFILGNTSANVGIGTSTPNTGTKLDVAGNFKLGSGGTVVKDIATGSGAINSTIASLAFTDITITLSSTLSGTTGTVTASPNFDLPTGIVVAFARIISTTTVRVRFYNASLSNQTVSGTVYATATDF